MDRLLQYPPSQPLVHVDHSHRRVLAAPPKRQVVTRGGCVYNPSYDGDSYEVTCSVPVHGVSGSLIDNMNFDLDKVENSEMTDEVNYLKELLEERSARFALVYYGASKPWKKVIERHGLKARGRYSVEFKELRDYLINQRDSDDFMIRLSNSETVPPAKPLR